LSVAQRVPALSNAKSITFANPRPPIGVICPVVWFTEKKVPPELPPYRFPAASASRAMTGLPVQFGVPTGVTAPVDRFTRASWAVAELNPLTIVQNAPSGVNAPAYVWVVPNGPTTAAVPAALSIRISWVPSLPVAYGSGAGPVCTHPVWGASRMV